jgi:hypothetical protein
MMTPQIDWSVLEQDYPPSEVNRREMDQFNIIQRGSVRLCMNLVRTEAEQRGFIRRGKELSLPRR